MRVALTRASSMVARIEAGLAAILALAVCALILLNVVTRTAGYALFWVDEVAIYCMVWMALLGASVTIQRRMGIAIDLVQDAFGPRVKRALVGLVDALILGFGVILMVLCWIWFDPLTLARNGFDIAAFTGATFNFLYREPTVTIGMPKWIVWLIMPIIATTITLHAITNLISGPPARDAAAKTPGLE